MFLHNRECFSCGNTNQYYQVSKDYEKVSDYVAAQKDLYEILYFRTFDEDRNPLETSTS